MRHVTLALLSLTLATPGLSARAPQVVRQGGPGQGGPPLPPVPIAASMPAADLSSALDAYIRPLAASDEFAGVVLVAKDGTTLFEKGYGLADRERKVPITPDLRFNVASIGKAFTKVAIGQLVGQGKLAFTDTVGTLLPDYPNAQARVATVDQLLNHTGGVADFFGPRFDAADKSRFTSNADYYRFVAPEPLLFEPGSRNQYCNGCYIVLGEIIAKITGVPYEQYIIDHVFKPAGMSGAGFIAYGDPKVALGYVRQERTFTSNDPFHGRRGSAAGGAFARAADLLAFDNALRERRLLDAKMTGWYLGDDRTAGRASGGYAIAGGAPGANADLEAEGTWTVAAVGNLSPPNASRMAVAISRALRGR